jgi:hypothetical protein
MDMPPALQLRGAALPMCSSGLYEVTPFTADVDRVLTHPRGTGLPLDGSAAIEVVQQGASPCRSKARAVPRSPAYVRDDDRPQPASRDAHTARPARPLRSFDNCNVLSSPATTGAGLWRGRSGRQGRAFGPGFACQRRRSPDCPPARAMLRPCRGKGAWRGTKRVESPKRTVASTAVEQPRGIASADDRGHVNAAASAGDGVAQFPHLY